MKTRDDLNVVQALNGLVSSAFTLQVLSYIKMGGNVRKAKLSKKAGLKRQEMLTSSDLRMTTPFEYLIV